jgi:hypothetical protein
LAEHRKIWDFGGDFFAESSSLELFVESGIKIARRIFFGREVVGLFISTCGTDW